MEGGLWLADEAGGEEKFYYYSELDEEVLRAVRKPLAGFVFPADMFMGLPLPKVPFYVEDWLPKRGKAMIFAQPKVGKSIMCMQLARCLGVGDDFLGKRTTPSRVLYLQFELGEEILQQRMALTKQRYENVWVGTSFSLKLDSQAGQNLVKRALDSVEPDVVIFDPVYKALLGDENENQDIRGVTDFLDSLIEAYNVSIWLVHHSGKDETKRGRGGSVWEDWVDSYLQLKMDKKSKGESHRVEIREIFLRHAPVTDPLYAELVPEAFEFKVVGATQTVKELIGEYIHYSVDPVSPSELFELGMGSNTSVYKALKALVEEGHVEQPERGKYIWRVRNE